MLFILFACRAKLCAAHIGAKNFLKDNSCFSATAFSDISLNFDTVKGGYHIIFASNVFHNSHLIQKCVQNQQEL